MSQSGSTYTMKVADFSKKLWKVISRSNIKLIVNAHSSLFFEKVAATVFPLVLIFWSGTIFGRKRNYKK